MDFESKLFVDELQLAKLKYCSWAICIFLSVDVEKYLVSALI